MMSHIVGTRRERSEEKFLLIILPLGIFGILYGEVAQLRYLHIFSYIQLTIHFDISKEKKKKNRKKSLTFSNA